MDKEYLMQHYDTYYKDKITFEEYLLSQYAYLQWEMNETKEWENKLENLIRNIYNSGLLKESEFNEELKEIYSTLDV